MIATFCIERLQRALKILEKHSKEGKCYSYRQYCKERAKIIRHKINAIEQGTEEPQLITFK